MENGDKSTTFGAIINIAKLSIGNGILALPFATSRGGLLFSPLAIALIAVISPPSSLLILISYRLGMLSVVL
jgi:amino acid permease